MEYNFPVLIGATLIVVTTYILYLKWLRMKYPPGPLPLPILGNLHLLTRLPQYGLTNLAKHYGPVYTFWMGSTPAVVICSFEGIREATVDKGKEFAGRAMDSNPLRMLFNDNKDLITRTSDDKHKVMRKLFQSVMDPKSNGGSAIRYVVEDEMQHLIAYIKSTNGNLEDPQFLINIPVSNAIVRTLFNFRFQSVDDPSFLQWIDMNKNFFSALESATMIDLFPFVWYIMPKLRLTISTAATSYDRFVDWNLTKHEETYQEGVIRDLTDAVIASQRILPNEGSSSQRLSRANVLGLLKNMLLAGIDTTSATIRWALLVLLHRSDIKRKLQQELDDYLLKGKTAKVNPDADEENDDKEGSSLLFTVADKPHLHYLNAFIHEVLRRCPIGPLAAPHKALVGTSICGLKIPKDTTVMLNIYASNMDEKVWEKPFEFIPERFLDKEGRFDLGNAKKMMAFGGGPRKCAGEQLGRMEIFYCLANVLHRFDLSCPSPDNLPSIDDGIYRIEFSPLSFKMSFNLRTPSCNEPFMY